jgi:hypothetical protein
MPKWYGLQGLIIIIIIMTLVSACARFHVLSRFCCGCVLIVAALATGNNSAEAATDWVFAHMDDPDFNDPLPPPAAAAAGAQQQQQLDPEQASLLVI